MLIEFLEKALATGCDSIEIEHKDGKEWVTAFWDCVGYGIGRLDADEAKPILSSTGSDASLTLARQLMRRS